MMMRLPLGSGVPVVAGITSLPCPGAQALSHGIDRNWASPVPTTGGSPKQVQPLPPSLAVLASRTRFGGTRKRMA